MARPHSVRPVTSGSKPEVTALTLLPAADKLTAHLGAPAGGGPLAPGPLDQLAARAQRTAAAGQAAEAERLWLALLARARAERIRPEQVLNWLGHLAALWLQQGRAELVAHWLDDGWFPATDLKHGSLLADTVWTAAQRGEHPQLAVLEQLLADAGHLGATLAQAQRLRLAADWRAALRLLQKVARDPAAQTLAADIRAEEDAAAVADLAMATQLAEAGLAVAAQTMLQNQAERWQQHPRFVHLRQQLQQAEQAQQAEAHLDNARSAFLAVTRGDLEAEAEGTEALARWADSWPWPQQPPVGLPEAWQAQVPGSKQLQLWWPTICSAHASGQPVVPRVAALPALHRVLTQQVTAATRQALRDDLRRLPAAWLALAQVQACRVGLEQLEASSWQATLATLETDVATALDRDDLALAAHLIEATALDQPLQSRALEPLRKDLLTARQRLQRREQLTQTFEVLLAEQAWFGARRCLQELQHLERREPWQTRQDRWLAAVGTRLQGRATPPGMQKLDRDKAVASARFGARALLVQGDIWMGLQLDTGGLQPFVLPSDATLEAATTRIAWAQDRWVASAISQGRLLRLEQLPGQPPQITAGIDLGEILQGDDQIVGLLTDPLAADWALVTRRGEGPQTHWTRLDGQRLDLLARSKSKPDILHAAPCIGDATTAWLVPHPKARTGFALGSADLTGTWQAQWRADEVGEPLAGLSQVEAWPDQDRIFARYVSRDPYDDRLQASPSLLVVKSGRVHFASNELRRRWMPLQPLQLDSAWTLDREGGALWFAALPEGPTTAGSCAVLAVDARTLRAQPPLFLPEMAQVRAVLADRGQAACLCLGRAGEWWLIQIDRTAEAPTELTRLRLPL
jgi:hypothetical protein